MSCRGTSMWRHSATCPLAAARRCPTFWRWPPSGCRISLSAPWDGDCDGGGDPDIGKIPSGCRWLSPCAPAGAVGAADGDLCQCRDPVDLCPRARGMAGVLIGPDRGGDHVGAAALDPRRTDLAELREIGRAHV